MLPEDDAILLSLVNMKLRDGCASPSDVSEELGADEEELLSRLRVLGYEYDEAQNAFRPAR